MYKANPAFNATLVAKSDINVPELWIAFEIPSYVATILSAPLAAEVTRSFVVLVFIAVTFVRAFVFS